MENSFSCNSGRAKLVDPNNFGLTSSDNISVPLEDLNVSVILKSFRKGRTLLSSDASGNVSENIGKIEVNFIEGTDMAGKKVLTSKFTDLTTVFDKDVINDETLGITSIDIEFNASYVPMITINFIDVRGSSIFQNEENILNNKGNKYTTFFQLPYPMFELEIKGYYGLPVKYCLHMLKFNSKFNSQTGNFEITCEFIGYTFALLSDALLGYLRAIPYTSIGAQRFQKYKDDTNRPILTLDELAKKISDINEGLGRQSEENPAAKQINTIENGRGYIETLKNRIITLGTTIDINTSKTSYDYIIFRHVNNFNTDQKTAIDSAYIENSKVDVKTYNEMADANFKLTEADFINIKTNTNKNGGKLYNKITITQLKSDDDTINDELKSKFNCKDDNELTQIKKSILDHITKYYKGSAFGDDQEIDIFDMSLLNKKLDELNKTLSQKLETEKTALAKDFENTVRQEFNFDPTIRPIMEMFTAAVEVFMETIYLVSKAAEENTERTDELAQKFTGADINVSDIHQVHLDKKVFFPWPDYREKEDSTDMNNDGNGGTKNSSVYVEKYLGTPSVLTSPQKVDELVFIEELLIAFRQSYKSQQDTINDAEENDTTWIPINAFDSFITSDTQPYERDEFLNANDIARMMVIRVMTFLGYSYNPELLSEEEIAALAQIEVDAMLKGIKDSKLKKSISDAAIDLNVFKNANGRINGVERPVLDLTGTTGYVVYDYIFKDLEWKLIPLNKGFNKESYKNNEPSLISKRDDDGFIFFTNYSSADDYANDELIYKKDDGGTYVQILDSLPDAITLVTPPDGVTNDSVISFEKIKQSAVDKSAGFNCFGGPYGVQEFKNMEWGIPSLQGLPLMYVFYRDTDTGLAYARKDDVARSPFSFWVDKYMRQVGVEAANVLYTNGSGKKLHDNLGENRGLFNKYISGGDANSITYPYIELPYSEDREKYKGGAFSLFGSLLYYQQASSYIGNYHSDEYARALLFLNTLPFNVDTNTLDPFVNSVINLFRNSSGIIHAPKLWCAWIGSILWRKSSEDPKIENNLIIGGGSGSGDPIKWLDYGTDVEKYQYFPSIGVNVKNNDDILTTSIIHRMPIQVKNEFKRIFFEFVNGTGSGVKWKDLSDKLEIFDSSDKGAYEAFKDYLSYFYGKNGATFNEETSNGDTLFYVRNASKSKLSYDEFYTWKKSGTNYGVKTDNIKKYYNIVTLTNGNNRDETTLFLELRDNRSDFPNTAVSTLLKALTEEVFILNSTYRIWGSAKGDKIKTPIKVNEALFNAYFTKVNEILKTKSDEFNPKKENEKADLAVFGTTDVDVIKLQLYKTCKNIYDKWLAGAKNENSLIFQCGGRSLTDTNLAKKYSGKDDAKPRMIDSFRFVSRSFRDIGDLLYINPLPINEMLLENTNTSAYDMIAKLLASNNFTFQPLPNFINFNDEKVMTSIFKPFNYLQDSIPKGSCGPSFVCVYAGQPSMHLDYGNPANKTEYTSKYPNDGFDLRCFNGYQISLEAPSDFVSGEVQNYEEPVSAFVVKYSQQNQNIFKDIDLDQSEYSETDESLKIQDEISQKGAENNRTIVGQNIYNVYAVRSYTAKVQMMGNAMIQPMMFFQLDNIPMFHGAYLITKVSHSIKPNTMSTTFNGTRIRYPQTRLVTANEVYMDLLKTFDTSAAGTGTIGSSGGVPTKSAPIVQTLIENGCSYSNINVGNIKACKVGKIKGISFQMDPNKQMICEAVEPLTRMLTDWTEWMSKNDFKPIIKENGDDIYSYITSLFRADGKASMHALGIAVDLQFFTKDKKMYNNNFKVGSSAEMFSFKSNPALKWLYQHSYEYGFVQPHWANDGKAVGTENGEEHWHWEYHGKAAIYQIRNRPIPAIGNNKASDNPLSEIKESKIKSFVHNPKGKDGKEAVYTNMDYKTINESDKANKIYSSVSDYPKGPATVKDQPIPNLNAGTLKFYDKLLDKLGAPKTDGNKFILMAWSQIENPSCNWNAFSTKQPYGGSVACINSGVNKNVQSFNNIDDGVAAAYKTLMNGNYPNLVAALKSGIKDKQQAYNVAVTLQKAPSGDFCVWKLGPTGCKNSNGVPENSYVAQILGTGKMSGKNIAGSK